MEIWNKDGISKHAYIPPYNYNNENDKYISSPIGVEYGNKNGTYYYLSFPCLSYVVPYIIFQFLSLPLTPISLQIFNLFLHFILCILLFRILRSVFSTEAAFYSILFYLFSPATLWFHGNAYTHQVFSQVVLVACLHFLFLYHTLKNYCQLLGFGFILLLLFLSEWISIFFSLFLLLFSLVHFKNSSIHRNLVYTVLVAFAVAAFIFYFQYNHFFGWARYWAYLSDRFSQRTIHITSVQGLGLQLSAWLKWNVVSYGPWLGLSVILLIQWKNKVQGSISIDKKQKTLFGLLFFPVMAYHFVFLEFTASHDYSVLPDALLWASLFAFLSFHVLNSSSAKKNYLYLTTFTWLMSLAQYYVINRPGKYGQNGDDYAIYQNIGEKVKQSASPAETLFMMGFDSISISPNNPQIMYYAKRNIQSVSTEEDARVFMKKFARKRGKLYILKNKTVYSVHELHGDSSLSTRNF